MAPSAIILHAKSRTLELTFGDDENYVLPCEYLRVYSPSAEVRGHGSGQEVLQTGKLNVAITDVKPVGNYALQLVFDDGHDTGIFSWDYLRQMGANQPQWWQRYLEQIAAAGASRDPDVQVLTFDP